MPRERTVLISACLLGEACRYNGTAKPMPQIRQSFKGWRIIPVCPEVLGELPIPRPPAEIQGGDGAAVWQGTAVVRNEAGADCTAAFKKGARAVLELARKNQPDLIILKANSPSCGTNQIYDGDFRGRLRPGDGVAAALLKRHGFTVFSELDVPAQSVRILGNEDGDAALTPKGNV